MRKMSKIAIINLKGGVGKSVTACNLACVLGWKYSRRVLVMDLDKQANTSKFFRCFDPEKRAWPTCSPWRQAWGRDPDPGLQKF